MTVVAHGPQRVELKATLRSPGLVILADTYYPGWRLTIDGKPAPIYRANRLMRGAAVPAGEHVLVYSYEPQSFRIGAIVSGVSLIALLALAVTSRQGPGLAPRRGQSDDEGRLPRTGVLPSQVSSEGPRSDGGTGPAIADPRGLRRK